MKKYLLILLCISCSHQAVKELNSRQPTSSPDGNREEIRQAPPIFKDLDQYQNESAFMDIWVHPNPAKQAAEITIEIEPHQDCLEVQLYVKDRQGQQVKLKIEDVSEISYGPGKIKRTGIYQGSLLKGERRIFQTKSILPTGIYKAHATYKQCGPGKSGEGENSFKFVII
jgi:hypothetical protein